MPVQSAPFGSLPDGREVTQFILRNSKGMEVRLINYGGIITHLFAPDRDGNVADVVMGFDELGPYLTDSPYFGALIGRFGNRIAGGRFELDGVEYRLDQNDGENHLHGGVEGFDKKLWDAEPFEDDRGAGVRLSLVSPDGDQGYPGNLSVTVEYWLTDDNQLITDYRATTDKATPVNLTQHSYFNLAGQGNVRDHQLTLNASKYTPVSDKLIPEGPLVEVAGTAFDFRKPKAIGAEIDADDIQLKRANGGYDHNFVVDRQGEQGEVLAARAEEPVSGRVLEVWTEEPCFQLYTGNFLDGSVEGKGQKQIRHGAFCVEPQHFPDSPNQDRFPSTIVRPGDTYHTRMSFRFSH
ncbi:aldose epimerase family protein [Marinimicrobium sp. LS-A18]|uniref:aldose epimerase family protein n=1 Tax=Marinimicrobium sp. LS-A18 TaxID=1381596 RepID=UPI0004B7829F|nr:aldose epimerase family protein [Marinimicrobium sp. LS-A18]